MNGSKTPPLRAGEVGWANVWKTQWGAVRSVTNIYSLPPCVVRHRQSDRNHCSASVFLKQTVEFNFPPCRATCFASVFLKQTVEFNHLFQKDQGKTASVARGTVEFNHLFQKDRGKTASAARILYPNPTDDLCLVF